MIAGTIFNVTVTIFGIAGTLFIAGTLLAIAGRLLAKEGTIFKIARTIRMTMHINTKSLESRTIVHGSGIPLFTRILTFLNRQ